MVLLSSVSYPQKMKYYELVLIRNIPVKLLQSLIPQISKRMRSKGVHYISGAYTPVTAEGNIVVDGVLASCYAFADHDLAHLAMTPIHLFHDLVETIFGNGNGSPVLC